MKLQDLLKEIELGKVYTDKDRKPFKVNEDGHTDVPSAIRKCKRLIDDAEDILDTLEEMDKEDSLPAWWTDKITIAADYIDTADDYINTEVEDVDEGKLNERLKRFKVFVSGEKEPLILLGKNEKDVKQTAYAMIQNSSIRVRKVVKEGFGGVTAPPPFSSKEAKKVVDDALRSYSKELRKLQGKVVKDWMSKAKAGVIDFFDLVRGFQHGDMSRAYPYEIEFLQSVLTKDKIIDRFRKYFGGKKAMKNRTVKK
jgi:uncharacterized protein YktA (UPF0223 family)